VRILLLVLVYSTSSPVLDLNTVFLYKNYFLKISLTFFFIPYKKNQFNFVIFVEVFFTLFKLNFPSFFPFGYNLGTDFLNVVNRALNPLEL